MPGGKMGLKTALKPVFLVESHSFFEKPSKRRLFNLLIS
jgi:hypothetical protein